MSEVTQKLTVRERIDPENKLPGYTVGMNQYVYDGLLRQDTWFYPEDDQHHEPCIAFTLVIDKNKHTVHFDGIDTLHARIYEEANAEGPGEHVFIDYRKKGYGKAAYLYAIEAAQALGYTFETQDATQSEHAVARWKSLASLGIAEVIEDFKPVRYPDGKFEGKYIVRPE